MDSAPRSALAPSRIDHWRTLPTIWIRATTIAWGLLIAGAAPSLAPAQEFSAVLVDTYGPSTFRAPFAVGGGGRVRWSTWHGHPMGGGSILNLLTGAFLGFKDSTRSYFVATIRDVPSREAMIFAQLQPIRLLELCGGSDSTHVFFPEQPPRYVCRNLGSDTIAGETVEKWEVKPRTGQALYVWVSRRLRWIVRSEDPNPPGETIEVRDIKEGPQQPSLFIVPPGYRQIEKPFSKNGWRAI